MLIVSGSIHVDPANRDSYVEGCRDVVEQARAATGCIDFAISPDILDAGRINIYERWEGEGPLLAFRGDGPSGGQMEQILSASVTTYEATATSI